MPQLRLGRDGHPVNDDLTFAVWSHCHFTTEFMKEACLSEILKGQEK